MSTPSSASRPAARPGGRTARVSEQVLAAALEMLGEDGVEGLQYDALAARAGVGRATLYRRWPTRDDLLHDVLERFAEQSIPLADTGDIEADLIAFVSAVATTYASPAGDAVLQAALRQGESSRLRDAGLRLLDERLADLQIRLDAATAVGQLPSVDAATVNRLLAGPVHLFMLRETRAFAPSDARRIVDVVVAGLRALG